MKHRRPPASPTEVALERATSRASNTYALIDKCMRVSMGELKRKKFVPSVHAADQAVIYVRALYRDAMEISSLVKRMAQEDSAPPVQPVQEVENA